MRTKKAGMNFITNLVMLVIGFLPAFFLRKVFLDSLGTDILGLSSLYSSILGLLSLAELGIYSAIIYALYKPFAEEDYEKVMGYIQYYTAFYRIVGIVILLAGLSMMPFLSIFIEGNVTISEARLYFLLTLAGAVSSYFLTAKSSLLIVAQENYRITITYTIFKVLTALLQMAALYLYESFYWFLIIQLLMNLLYFQVINSYIGKRFKWSKSKAGTIDIQEKKELKKNIKALFIHKIGELTVFGTDNLLVSYFINLTAVGIYNSYQMVIAIAGNVISNAFGGITASVGNLLVQGDKEKIYAVHKRIFFFSFWIVSFLYISMSNTLRQFVLLWLGETQYLDTLTLNIILVNFYITLMRSSVEKFKEAGGLYRQDQYAAVLEAIVNLVCSMLLVQWMGLPGIFLGTLISNVTVVFWVKPRIVYKYIFKQKLRLYFWMYFKYCGVALIGLLVTYGITNRLQDTITLWAFLLNCLLNIVIINGLYLLVFRRNPEFLYFKKLVWSRLTKWIPDSQAD